MGYIITSKIMYGLASILFFIMLAESIFGIQVFPNMYAKYMLISFLFGGGLVYASKANQHEKEIELIKKMSVKDAKDFVVGYEKDI